MKKCKYCKGDMSLAWPATKDKGSIMSCKKCRATCQTDGKRTWDWREGVKDASE